MMRVSLRTACAAAVGVFLIAGQLPAPAMCAVGIPGLSAISCTMPCCKGMPASGQCPKVKPTPKADTITPHPLAVTPSFQILTQVSGAISSTVAPRCKSIVRLMSDVRRLFFDTPPLLGRAPPTDVALLSA